MYGNFGVMSRKNLIVYFLITTQNAGEYYVCAELCRRNILALITPKNNPLFDIVASDPEGKRSVQIQVKTMSINNKQGWKLGVNMAKKHNNPKLFVVLVNMHDQKSTKYVKD